jgi:assimilatory nitrate reductase catalytic subunit
MTGTVRTTCPYCGVGCGVIAAANGTGGWTMSGDPNHPANFGRLCSKGSALAETLGSGDDRLLHPMVRGRRTDWDTALSTVAAQFQSVIDRHGPEAVAFYVSGQILTEDYYVANKLIKGFIGTANIDTNSRLCMASSVAGHKRAFGSDTVPGNYEDLEQADLVVLVGSNTAWCHPILFQRLAKARQDRGTRIVVVDPRRTATCDIADLHLPLRPGSDVRLFNGLLTHLTRIGPIARDFVEAHTTGFDAALAQAGADAPSIEATARACGLSNEAVQQFFDAFAATENTVTVYSQGVNQSSRGTDKVNAIINCHLATGRIGRPGMGPLSFTGQPNAMGGREVGGLANQLAAHMGFAPDEVDRVRRFWNAPAQATREGLKAVDLFRAIDEGRIKALWVMGTNPAVSLPDAGSVRRALGKLDFLAVSDCTAETDTNAFAHVLLPATGWSEKDGTVTNSERRISRQRAFVTPSGEAKPDWWIVTQIARRMGWADAFPYEAPAEIFREHAALSAFENNGARDFDIGPLATLSAEAYDALRPVQWPIRADGSGTDRLFGDGRFFTPDRAARFIPVTNQEPVNRPTTDYPLVLNTGRVRDQWHTMTRTGLVPRLSTHRSEPFIEVHPEDAACFEVTDNTLATVETAWGDALVRVRVTPDQGRGSIFLPMHWTDQFTGNAIVGRLVNPVADPISGQPEAKHTPARLRPLTVGWTGFLLTRNKVRPTGADYWTRISADGCTLYELACEHPPADLEAWAAGLLGEGRDRIDYHDARRGIHRWAVLDGDRIESCLFTAAGADVPATRDWLTGLFKLPTLDAQSRAGLLSGRPAQGGEDKGKIVCACHGVGVKCLRSAIHDRNLKTVEQLGTALKAGTNCGSCIPEIKELIQSAAA